MQDIAESSMSEDKDHIQDAVPQLDLEARTAPNPSKGRIIVAASIMLLTYYLGVGSFAIELIIVYHPTIRHYRNPSYGRGPGHDRASDTMGLFGL